MTVDTVIWAAMAAVISATLVFVGVGGALTGFLDSTWDEVLPPPKPRWLRRLKLAVDVVLWLVPALFLLLFLRHWLL
jgi:hypothetical protein